MFKELKHVLVYPNIVFSGHITLRLLLLHSTAKFFYYYKRKNIKTFGKTKSQHTNKQGPSSSHCSSHQEKMFCVV